MKKYTSCVECGGKPKIVKQTHSISTAQSVMRMWTNDITV